MDQTITQLERAMQQSKVKLAILEAVMAWSNAEDISMKNLESIIDKASNKIMEGTK